MSHIKLSKYCDIDARLPYDNDICRQSLLSLHMTKSYDICRIRSDYFQICFFFHIVITISNTRAIFAYHSFRDNLRLQCYNVPLRHFITVCCRFYTISNYFLLRKSDVIKIVMNPDENYSILETAISDSMNAHLEKKIVKFNRRKHKKDPWITYGILNSVNHKNRLYKRLMKINRDTPLFMTKKQEFNAYKNSLRKIINITIFRHNSKKIKEMEKKNMGNSR